MITWSLVIGGTQKTLAEWRVNGVALRRLNLAGDTLTFTAPRAGFDALLCAYGAEIKLVRTEGSASETWFVGQSQTIPDHSDARSQLVTYTAVSPWRWLAENIFQQPWYSGTLYTSHIITIGSVGSNIKAVLDYAIANGADLQYAAAELTALAVTPPTNEFTEKTCAQVIIENLQFAPDTVVWFDYETTPPTLRLQQRGSLVAVPLRMASHDDDSLEKVASCQLMARPDLQVPSVKLNFEVIENIDGVDYLIPGVEVYPPSATGREDGAFNAVLTIQGRSVQNVTGEIECATIDTSSIEWWKQHIAALRDDRLTILTGPNDVERVDRDGVALATTYARELLPGGGAIAPWMELDWQIEVIKCKFATQTMSGSDVIRIDDEREVSVELITTNAPAGVSSYSTVASADSGDAQPVGLSAFLYNSLSVLHYQGSIRLEQKECDGIAGVGNVINLFGARAEHQTMRALVQEASFDIDSGITNLICGPPRQLSLSDVLALLQRFRVRRRWTNPATQGTGEVGTGSGSDIELARASGTTNSLPGASVDKKYMVRSGSTKITLDAEQGTVTVTDGTNTILLDAPAGRVFMNSITAGAGSMDLLLSATAGKNIAFRQIGVCVNGINRSVIGALSEIF